MYCNTHYKCMYISTIHTVPVVSFLQLHTLYVWKSGLTFDNMKPRPNMLYMKSRPQIKKITLFPPNPIRVSPKSQCFGFAASASAWRETKFCLVKMVSPSKKGQNSAEAKYWYFASASRKKRKKSLKNGKKQLREALLGFFKFFGVVVHCSPLLVSFSAHN